MDWIDGKNKALEYIKKYRYIAIVIVVGLLLMVLPEPHTQDVQTQQPVANPEPDLESALEDLLSQIEGAGKVEVLLTEEEGALTVYQTDENATGTGNRNQTILITNSDREETGLIRQTISPQYRGAVIVSQGADRAEVRLSIVEAVMSVTGLTSDRISVLKMK